MFGLPTFLLPRPSISSNHSPADICIPSLLVTRSLVNLRNHGTALCPSAPAKLSTLPLAPQSCTYASIAVFDRSVQVGKNICSVGSLVVCLVKKVDVCSVGFRMLRIPNSRTMSAMYSLLETLQRLREPWLLGRVQPYDSTALPKTMIRG